MTNAPVRARSTTSATSSRSTTTARPPRVGADPDDGAGRAAPDEPRQRPHPDAVGRLARTPASPPARRGSRSTRTTPRSTRPPQVADPDSVFHHYRRLIELRHDRAGGRARRLHHAAAADDPRVYAFTRRLGDDRAAGARQLLRRTRVAPTIASYAEWVARRAGAGQRGRRLPARARAPWEARVHRRTVAAGHDRAMNTWLVAGAVALALWALSCLLMMLFAHRLPNGLLRQVAEFLPACVTTARTLRKHPDVPRRAKIALLVAVALGPVADRPAAGVPAGDRSARRRGRGRAPASGTPPAASRARPCSTRGRPIPHCSSGCSVPCERGSASTADGLLGQVVRGQMVRGQGLRAAERGAEGGIDDALPTTYAARVAPPAR